MAERRMFSKSVIGTDAFLDMSSSTKMLYFYLMSAADDDGFVDNPKGIMRYVGCAEDDMRILLAKRFVLSFQSGLIVIKHWRIHNCIRKDLYKKTAHVAELDQLSVNEDGEYVFRNEPVTETLRERNELVTETLRTRNENVTLGKDSIGKYRLVEDSIVKDSIGENRENEEEVDNNIPPISPLMIETVSSVIKGYTQNPTIRGLLREFVELRQKKRKPLTARAMKMALNKLDELAGDDGQKEEIIKQTILHAWDSFYRIAEEYHPKGENRQKSLEEQVRENEERLRRKGII